MIPILQFCQFHGFRKFITKSGHGANLAKKYAIQQSTLGENCIFFDKNLDHLNIYQGEKKLFSKLTQLSFLLIYVHLRKLFITLHEKIFEMNPNFCIIKN